MSKVEYERYLKAYNDLLEKFIELHNKHLTYKANFGRETVRNLRRTSKHMREIQRELEVSALSSYYEHRENTKTKLANKRVEKAIRKANPLKRGPKKKKNNVDLSGTGSK